MPTREINPLSETSTVILTSTGSAANVATAVPFGIYTGSLDFITGAANQVDYVYKKLGGDVVDIELTVDNVYAAYEEAVLEYSYIVNIHQSKNILHSSLGATTGTFDSDGQLSGSNQPPSDVALRYPKFEFGYSKRVMDSTISDIGLGGSVPMYSASFDTENDVQDYDLQELISSSADDSDMPFFNKVGNKRVIVKRVYYKTPHAMWRFYGYYGGLNVVGNLHNYGQFTDDATFQLVPVWENKAQAMAFEDHLYTRLSHYSYEIRNNKLRLYPSPDGQFPNHMWVTFTLQKDGWQEDDDRTTGIGGINNMNTLPFPNVPYKNINSIGKQWIRRYALALTKEILGQIRGKFTTIPIPGESITLNASDLLSQAKEEQSSLKEELKTVLDQMTYKALAEQDAAMVAAIDTVYQEIPLAIFQG